MTLIRRFIAGALALGWMFATPAVVLMPAGPAGATVDTLANKTIVAGNGAQTVFTFNFIGVAAQYISVVYTDASGNQTTLTQGSGATQYQLSLNPPVQGAVWGVGGTVTYNPNGTPIAAGTTLTIMRTLPLTQAVSLANQQSMQALGKGAETAVDTAVMQGQQISEQIGRALQMNASNASPPNPLPPAAQAAGQGLCFDGSGNNVIACSLAPSGVISPAMAPVVGAASVSAGRTALGLGTMAQENINAGTCGGATVQDDGAGNARVVFATAADAANQTVTCAFHGTRRIATGSLVYTLPRANTLFNGFAFSVYVSSGQATFVPNAADNFFAQGSGTSTIVPAGSVVTLTTNAASTGVWYASTQPLGAGANQCLSIVSFGGVGNNSTDNTAPLTTAFNALSGNGGCIYFPPGKYKFNSQVALNLPSGVFSLALRGGGQDNTILTWPNASGGILINYAGTGSSTHISDISVTTGMAAGGNGITLSQSSAVSNPANTAPSDFTHVTFRGDDGYGVTDYWSNGISIANVSNVQFDNVSFTGASSPAGNGINLLGNPSGSSYAVQFNISKGNFTNLSGGIIYGSFIQGVTVSQSNFVNDTNGIISPSGQTGSLAQLAVTNSQFGILASQSGIATVTAVAELQVSNSLFVIQGANATGLNLQASAHFTATGNEFAGNNTTNTNGIFCANTAAGSKGIATGNDFFGLGAGAALTSTCANVAIAGNTFNGNTSNITNAGLSDTTTPQY